MTIFHLYYGLLVGGIETMLVNIANEQVKEGHTIKILILNNAIDQNLYNQIDNRVEIVNFKKKRGSQNPIPVFKLNWYLLKHHFDILHVHNPRFDRLLRIPIPQNRKCSTLHCLCKGALDSDYLHCFEHNFAISEAVRRDILNKYGIQSTTVYNGIHPERFISNGIKLNKDGAFHIIQVGRLNVQVKGQDILIKAIGILKKKGYKNIIVDFVGGDQNSLVFLQNQANELNIENQINFLGIKDQEYISYNLCKYDLYIQPSRLEGFGLTIAEAMAAGIPVLTSDVPGPMDIINNGEFGLFFESGNANSCADKIEFIIHHQNEMSKMAGKAKERVYKLFDVKVTAKTYLDQYSIINNND